MTSENLIAFLIIFPMVAPVVFVGCIYLFDYISDSDIWIKREDRDQ